MRCMVAISDAATGKGISCFLDEDEVSAWHRAANAIKAHPERRYCYVGRVSGNIVFDMTEVPPRRVDTMTGSKPVQSKPKTSEQGQLDRLKQTARKLGCDKTGEAFEKAFPRAGPVKLKKPIGQNADPKS